MPPLTDKTTELTTLQQLQFRVVHQNAQTICHCKKPVSEKIYNSVSQPCFTAIRTPYNDILKVILNNHFSIRFHIHNDDDSSKKIVQHHVSNNPELLQSQKAVSKNVRLCNVKSLVNCLIL